MSEKRAAWESQVDAELDQSPVCFVIDASLSSPYRPESKLPVVDWRTDFKKLKATLPVLWSEVAFADWLVLRWDFGFGAEPQFLVKKQPAKETIMPAEISFFWLNELWEK